MHCKDLMVLMMHVMQGSQLLQSDSGAQPKDMVLFVSKDTLEDAIVFEVTLGESGREMHEYLEVLSEHYLGVHLVHLKSGQWRNIDHARYCAGVRKKDGNSNDSSVSE